MSLSWVRRLGTALDSAQGSIFAQNGNQPQSQQPQQQQSGQQGYGAQQTQSTGTPTYPTFGYNTGQPDQPPAYTTGSQQGYGQPHAQQSQGYKPPQAHSPSAPSSYSQPQAQPYPTSYPQQQQQPQQQQLPQQQQQSSWQSGPPQVPQSYSETVRKPTPVSTTLGFDGLMWWCIELAASKKSSEKDKDNFLTWSFADLCTESMHYNLCCPCMVCAGLAVRVFLGMFAGFFMMFAFLFVALAHLVPVIAFLFKSVCSSPQFGPILKICLSIGIVPLAVISLITIPIVAFFQGLAVLLAYVPSVALSAMFGGLRNYFGKGLTAKKEMYALYEQEGSYTELKVLHALLALLYLVLGAVICCIGFLGMKIIKFPQLFGAMLKDIWANFDMGQRNSRRVNEEEQWPCELCFTCCMNSVQQFCSLCSFPFRLVASMFSLVILILAWPFAALYGLFAGAIAGAGVYSEPKAALTFSTIGAALSAFWEELQRAVHGSTPERVPVRASRV